MTVQSEPCLRVIPYVTSLLAKFSKCRFMMGSRDGAGLRFQPGPGPQSKNPDPENPDFTLETQIFEYPYGENFPNRLLVVCMRKMASNVVVVGDATHDEGKKN